MSAKLLRHDGFCSAKLGKIAGDATSTVYRAQGGPSLTNSAPGLNFIQMYKAAYDTNVLIYAANFYDGVMIIAKAMHVANSTTDKSKIRAALSKTDFQGIAGHYVFDANGNLKDAPSTVYKSSDSKLMPY